MEGLRRLISAGVTLAAMLAGPVSASVGASEGDIDVVDPPISWSMSWLWLGAVYRTPGRLYGKGSTGFSRARAVFEWLDERNGDTENGWWWGAGLGIRVAGGVYLEVEYETIARIIVDESADDAVRGVHLMLMYRAR